MDAGDGLRNNVSPRGTKPQECCVDRLDRKILELLQKDGALTAAATILTAPLVIAFLVARRRFIEGITMTGVK